MKRDYLISALQVASRAKCVVSPLQVSRASKSYSHLMKLESQTSVEIVTPSTLAKARKLKATCSGYQIRHHTDDTNNITIIFYLRSSSFIISHCIAFTVAPSPLPNTMINTFPVMPQQSTLSIQNSKYTHCA